MRDIAVAILLLSGVSLTLIASIGINRFPDVFARMHAASKPATLGLLLVLTAAALRATNGDSVTKLALVAILQLLTAPTGAHMIGRAAYQSGTELAPDTVLDEIADQRPLRFDEGDATDPT